MTPKFTIVVAKNEQKPPPLDNARFPFVFDTMPVGDYSILGFHNWENPGLSIERKSIADLYGTLGGGLKRFWREIMKMRQFKTRMLIVEGQPDDLAWYIQGREQYLKPQGRRPLTFNSAIATLTALSSRTGLQIIWCDDAYHAAREIEAQCEMFARGVQKDFLRLGGKGK